MGLLTSPETLETPELLDIGGVKYFHRHESLHALSFSYLEDACSAGSTSLLTGNSFFQYQNPNRKKMYSNTCELRED